ncbi:neuronal acetylcholine receptor subunit alpha-6-like [Ruditapes philippinarum]|uniref:neuronal acetylcholine receptor subunit alpha-6-like n=1 Tax=Ruditapes philippinarum TaxID=129788 RepID=UPI00295B1E4D|nr:neuronal acetylcholine receptor subunit alpha-6-like [Ruditapes philippinarum]
MKQPGRVERIEIIKERHQALLGVSEIEVFQIRVCLEIQKKTCECIVQESGLTLKPKYLLLIVKKNGEWELINTGYKSLETVRESESFSRLVFSLTFRRRPMFHSLNTLFPVVLMAFLTVIIFKLNPESGERVGLALTILLAYAVYLGVISESIPQTSLSASLLSSYIACILFLQTLAVFLTVLYLDTYFNPDDKPVPKWLHVVTSSVLIKLACVDCSRKNKKVSPNPSDMNNDSGTVPQHKSDYNKSEKIVSIEDNEEDKNGVREANESTPSDKEYSWKEIALLLDKVTMYIYLSLVTALTVVTACVMLVHYGLAY